MLPLPGFSNLDPCRAMPDANLLLAGPLVAPSVVPHPGGGVRVRHRIEDVLIGVWRGGPGARHELEQATRAAAPVHGVWIEVGLAAGDPQHIFAGLPIGIRRRVDNANDAVSFGGRRNGHSIVGLSDGDKIQQHRDQEIDESRADLGVECSASRGSDQEVCFGYSGKVDV